MSEVTHRTAPEETEKMPSGIPFIISNELAERFSFYGMKAILFVFMTKYLMGADGALATMSDAQATSWVHYFGSAVYFTPLLGALLADLFFGKYKVILVLSIVYCFGHLALALDETKTGLLWGLGLIALGAGGIKPCVSAHVGDQFGKKNAHLLAQVFFWFYFSINFGSFFSTLFIPSVLENFGPHLAFGIPGVLMAVATVFFWMGRKHFAHIPPDREGFIREAFSKEGLRVVLKLGGLYLFIAMFWALFDQTASRWVEQAAAMDRTVPIFGELLPSQIQAINPILVLILIPVFSLLIYPAIGRVVKVTPMRKVAVGLFVAAAAFAISAWIQGRIDQGETPGISWQILAYLVLTAAEVMISITGLEYSYSQAPPRLKSWIMSLFLLSVSLGNLFVGIVNSMMESGSLVLDGATYYWFFTKCAAVTAVLFLFVMPFFKDRTYLQDGTVIES